MTIDPTYGNIRGPDGERIVPPPSSVPGDPQAHQEMQEDADAACDPAEQERIWRLIRDAS